MSGSKHRHLPTGFADHSSKSAFLYQQHTIDNENRLRDDSTGGGPKHRTQGRGL